MSDRWLMRKREAKHAKVRLFCFPHAGAGAAIFNGWLTTFPSTIDVCAIEPPGRLIRRREPAARTITEFILTLDSVLSGHLDLPFAMFGYSLGALMAYEWCRAIRQRSGREPERLIVAASSAPHLPPRHAAISELPKSAFMQGIEARYGSIDPALRADREMLDLILGILRTDLGMLENYRHVPDRPFNAPILAIGGSEDPGVTRERLEAWQHHTTLPLHTAVLPGGHFFLRTGAAELAALVRDSLATSGAVSDLPVP